MENINELNVKCLSFENDGDIPKQYTAFGENISPAFKFCNLSGEAVTIAIIMDDLDIPVINEFNHWCICNIPKTDIIPEAIPAGTIVKEFGNAIQGIGYGRHKYMGPKQPVFIRNMHRYKFQFYVLDAILLISPNYHKQDLIKAMQGHILQYGEVIGKYQR